MSELRADAFGVSPAARPWGQDVWPWGQDVWTRPQHRAGDSSFGFLKKTGASSPFAAGGLSGFLMAVCSGRRMTGIETRHPKHITINHPSSFQGMTCFSPLSETYQSGAQQAPLRGFEGIPGHRWNINAPINNGSPLSQVQIQRETAMERASGRRGRRGSQ